ncbi:MAG: hypothetical protein E7C49_00250 [Clostridium sp.]|nr:hypothetical protein [Clostridium sp.]
MRKKIENNCILNEKQLERFMNYFELLKVNDRVYPSKIKSDLLIDYKTAYKLLDIIKDLGYLEYNYELYCSKCERFIDEKPLKSLSEFKKDFYCDENHILNPIDDTIVIYRVVKID